MSILGISDFTAAALPASQKMKKLLPPSKKKDLPGKTTAFPSLRCFDRLEDEPLLFVRALWAACGAHLVSQTRMVKKVAGPLRSSSELVKRLQCPVCKSKLHQTNEHFKCLNPICKTLFPRIGSIPILINPATSIFSTNQPVDNSDNSSQGSSLQKFRGKLRTLLKALTPTLSLNIKASQNYSHFVKLLPQKNPHPKVLVLGGRTIGQGLKKILLRPDIEFVETDVALGPQTILICDAHDIPFEDQTFDGVIIQAVLEHVVDPYRCVEEIHRVLKDTGLVYAETPFMQQAHEGRYDFTRFTHLGHRRLFGGFDCIQDGVVCGPGMALAWSCKYFLLSFAQSKISRSILDSLAGFLFFWIKYFDYFLIRKPGAFDAASGYYFMGKKSLQTLSDKELVTLYRGAIR